MAKPPHHLRGRNQQPQQQGQPGLSVHTQQMQWSGPLPPPAALEKFNEIIPNGADRIVKMAEAEQAHRHTYEKDGLAASTAEASRGQFLGAFISCLAICAAGYAAHVGAHAAAAALVGIPILGIVQALIRPRGK